MSDKWKELAQASCWRHHNGLVTQYQFSVPISDLEAKDSSVKGLILDRIRALLEDKECD